MLNIKYLTYQKAGGEKKKKKKEIKHITYLV
jgi:hypothetical protein